MKTGLILGKFMPLHMGHISMVNFALQHCDKLILLLCSTEHEVISGAERYEWLVQTFSSDQRIQLYNYEYDEAKLPNTSVSSENASQVWAAYLKATFPNVDVIITSEPYGECVARYMGIGHICYDQLRTVVPVSSTTIRNDPFQNWSYIPMAVRPFFIKKVCISGTESTGKSTLAKRLAEHFNTVFVPEMARSVVDTTASVTFEDLTTIAEVHATAINEAMTNSNKILIVDTDLNITRSYAAYLFQRSLSVPLWVEIANTFHLHLFLEPDCLFVQDGTRLSEAERNRLSIYHKWQLDKNNIQYDTISGDWDQRFQTAVQIIDAMLMNSNACEPEPLTPKQP